MAVVVHVFLIIVVGVRIGAAVAIKGPIVIAVRIHISIVGTWVVVPFLVQGYVISFFQWVRML
jgi:hypothetical protein